MSKHILLQKAVARPNSIRSQLSDLSWSRGIANFFLEDIPFSYSTGYDHAAKIVAFIDQFATNNPDKPITVLELGSGTGLLCLRILDLLHQENYTFAKDVHIIITDFSEALIEQIKASSLFDRYTNQVSFYVFDFLTDSYDRLPPFDMVIMSYLLDSIGHHHLEYNHHGIFEKHVTSYYDRTGYIFDTATLPPKIVPNDEKATFIHDIINTQSYEKLSQLRDNVKEYYSNKDLSQTTFNESTIIDINNFLTYLKPDNPFYFNYSPAISKALKQLFKQLPDHGMALIYDFGIPDVAASKKTTKSLLGKYGICLFFAVYFPYIHYLAEQQGLSFLQTQFDSGHSQCCVITKNKTSYKTVFNNCFSEPGSLHSTQNIKRIKRYKGNPLALHEYIKKIHQDTPPYEKHAYTLLMTIAIALKDAGLYEEALQYIYLIKVHYGSLSLSAIQLEVSIYNDCKQPELVVKTLTPLLKQHPFMTSYFYYYCLALVDLGQKDHFLALLPTYIQKCDLFIPWRFFLIASVFCYDLKNTKQAQHFLNYIHDTAKQYPDLIKPDLLSAADQLQVALTPS
ncbi:hypothetical protein DID76_04030 [Candidatus Marinamargulisbacteria bacterium SCGC AG-414-C22]|nr:hypothetical protein DID76_04030 [Candidatus Marinamargulisbacteria bacterium SCGC AG-414-C22]